MKYQCYVFNSNKVEIGHFCKSQVKQMFLITNILHNNLHCILVLLWNNQMDKKFHHSVFVFHKLHVRRYAGDARETFVLWPLNGLGHLCMCASVCVCALLEHQEAIWATATFTICHIPPFLPHALHLYCILYLSLYFPLYSICFPPPMHRFANKCPFLHNHPYCHSVYL